MKVIIIGPAHPLRGGLASFDERLAREFLNNGHDAVIYTFSLQYPSFLFPGTTQYSTEPAPKDLKINVSINSINPVNWLITGRKIAKETPDIVVVRYWLPFMGPCLGTILRIVKKRSKAKIICIADNIRPHEQRPGDAAFTKYFLKPVDAFITMSEAVLNDLKNVSSKPATLVQHPLYDNFGEKVDKVTAREKLNLPKDKKIALFFGFIRKYKGLDLLLEAIKILKKRSAENDIRFLIAGEFYEQRKVYDDYINEHNLHELLILHTEFIPDSDVKYYLGSADVVIQPYKNATQSGVTPLAYHFEVPMIVTNVGGLPSMVPSTCGLVAEPNALSLAEKVTEFFSGDHSAFISNIREEKKKYSWSRLVTSIISFR